MIRILHIIGKMNRAGAETMLMNLYRKLDKEKYQFDFLYFSDETCDYDEEIQHLGGKIYRIPFNQYKNPISRMFALYQLLKREKQFNIIHSHTLFSNGYNLIAAYLAGVKFRIAHSHNTSDIKNKSFLLDKTYKYLSRYFIYKLATHTIACGKVAAAFLFPYQSDCFLLPNAINVDLFNEIGEKEIDYIEKKLNLDNNCLIIIQLGRLDPVKNHTFSIDLAKFMKDHGKIFHMIIVGDGKLNKELKQLVVNYKIENYISFLGIRTDIPELLAGSDVMLMPSLYEGFPVVLVESQSVGIPALISSSISHEVDLGVGLVEFLDLNADFKIWMDTLFTLRDKEKMANNKRINILKDKGFDINTSIKRLEDLYNDCNSQI